VFDVVNAITEGIIKTKPPPTGHFDILDTIFELFGSRFYPNMILNAIKFDNVEALQHIKVSFNDSDLFVKLCTVLNEEDDDDDDNAVTDYPMKEVGLFALNNIMKTITPEQFSEIFINSEPEVFKAALDLLTIEEAICLDVSEYMLDSKYFNENWEYFMSECKRYYSNIL
jgi:hypothetical protein